MVSFLIEPSSARATPAPGTTFGTGTFGPSAGTFAVPEEDNHSFERSKDVSLELALSLFIQESPRYLFMGTTLGAMGFLIAVIPFVMRIATDGLKDIDEMPATVSELVSKWEMVEARIFFGFELCAAFCILLSWYPFKMQNGCCIPAQQGCRINFCGSTISWASFRQFMPPLGLMLVACVPTVGPEAFKELQNLVLVAVHCLAAMLMFIGFLAAEAHTLSIYPFSCPFQVGSESAIEYKLRALTWAIAAVTFITFTAIQGVGGVFPLKGVIKVASFLLEVVAGLAMLGNQFAIWFFSSERRMGRQHRTKIGSAGSSDEMLEQQPDTPGASLVVGRRGMEVSLQVAAQQFIQISSRYLIVGVVLGLMSRFVAVVPLLMRVAMFGTHGEKTKMPATFTELVAPWETVESRVFFGFEMASAFCILLSGYAFELRNASCIPSNLGCYIFCGHRKCTSWADFRQYVVPVGTLLAALIPGVSLEDFSKPPYLVLFFVHAMAFMLKALGFLVAEAHTLSIPPFSCKIGVVEPGSSQYRLRMATWICCLVSLVVYQITRIYVIFQTHMGHPDDRHRVKTVAMCTDILVSLSILTNLGVVWKCASERHWHTRNGASEVSGEDSQLETAILDQEAQDLTNPAQVNGQTQKWSMWDKDPVPPPPKPPPGGMLGPTRTERQRRRNTHIDLKRASEHFLLTSVPFLILGALLGMLGFLLAALTFVLKTWSVGYAYKNIPMDVSELVAQWDRPEARVFFGFELSASFCILASCAPAVAYDSEEYRCRYQLWLITVIPCSLNLFLKLYGCFVVKIKLRWKITSFLCQMIGGMAIMGSHVAIWYFSPERNWDKEGGGPASAESMRRTVTRMTAPLVGFEDGNREPIQELELAETRRPRLESTESSDSFYGSSGSDHALTMCSAQTLSTTFLASVCPSLGPTVSIAKVAKPDVRAAKVAEVPEQLVNDSSQPTSRRLSKASKASGDTKPKIKYLSQKSMSSEMSSDSTAIASSFSIASTVIVASDATEQVLEPLVRDESPPQGKVPEELVSDKAQAKGNQVLKKSKTVEIQVPEEHVSDEPRPKEKWGAHCRAQGTMGDGQFDCAVADSDAPDIQRRMFDSEVSVWQSLTDTFDAAESMQMCAASGEGSEQLQGKWAVQRSAEVTLKGGAKLSEVEKNTPTFAAQPKDTRVPVQPPEDESQAHEKWAVHCRAEGTVGDGAFNCELPESEDEAEVGDARRTCFRGATE